MRREGERGEERAALTGTGASTVLVTYPDQETAGRISKALIDERLAACANIFPVRSVYRWKGQVLDEAEVAVLYKITSADFEAFEKAVRRLHPYDVPCIVRYDIAEGHGPYLDWIRGSTARPPPD